MIKKVVRNRSHASNTNIESVSMLVEEDNTFSGSNFLIIDDFAGMRNTLIGLLRNCGAAAAGQIDGAASAGEALGMLSSKQYDVVLCDYNLGPGKNGVQLYEEVKFKNLLAPSSCWLIISAEKSIEGVMGMMESRPDAYLIKPVTEAALATRLKKLKLKKKIFENIDKAILSKNYQSAIDLCTKLIPESKENAIELFRLKCELLIQTEQYVVARQLLDSLLRKRELPWAQLMMAQIIKHDGNYSQAQSMLENIVNKNRSYLSAYDELAEVCCQLNAQSRAESVLEKAISISPKSMKRQQKMGEVAMNQRHFERAEKAFRESVSLGENSIFKTPNSYAGLARSLSAQGKITEALNVVKPLTEIFSDTEEIKATSKALEGLIYHENNQGLRAEEAARELAKLLSSGTENLSSDTLKDAAVLLLNSSEKDLGVKLLQTEIMNNPEDEKTNDWVINVFKSAGLGEQGSSVVESSRKKATKIMDESVLMMHSGNFAKAIDGMREALQVMPKNARLLLNMAHVLITFMELKGYKSALAREARRYLMTAHQCEPKEKRYGDLTQRLEDLSKHNRSE